MSLKPKNPKQNSIVKAPSSSFNAISLSPSSGTLLTPHAGRNILGKAAQKQETGEPKGFVMYKVLLLSKEEEGGEVT